MSEITEYDPIEAGLAECRQRYAGTVYDLRSTAGNESARAARRELVTLRTTLEAKRKALKAPVLEQAKLIDDEAKRITTELLTLERPIDEQIKADEARREQERKAREEAERARVIGIHKRMAALTAFPTSVAHQTAARIATAIVQWLGMKPKPEDFDEFISDAEGLFTDGSARLNATLEAAEAREAEEARKKAEAEAEAARLKTEREALEREKSAELERARVEREAQAAENARIAAERAEVERVARESREAEAAQLAAERNRLADQQTEIERLAAAERASLAQQRAELQRQREAMDRRRREAQAAVDAAKAPAVVQALEAPAAVKGAPKASRPTDDEIIEVLALHFRVHELKVIEWLLNMNLEAASKREAELL